MKVVAQAPLRLSLLGGSSDLPVFYQKYKGLCISMAINLRQHVELSTELGLTDYGQGDGEFFNQFFLEYQAGIKSLKTWSDAPIRSGLGSSASIAVALVAALSRIKGQNLTKSEIAEKAWSICNNELGLYSGKQDEVAASFGGFNMYEFEKDGSVNVFPVKNTDFWQKHILLFDTGIRRTNPKIQEELKQLSETQEQAILEIKETANYAFHSVLNQKDTTGFAQLISRAWEAKKKSNPLVTNEQIDYIHDTAVKAGALGGKLCGSGGGGFIWFLVEPEKQEKVVKSLEEVDGVVHYKFDIDWEGVKVT